jgi:GTP 3',8-cyclase
MVRLPIICESDLALDQGPDPIPLAARGTAGYPGWLADRDGRQLRYLRLSVTDRCDLHCTYCMPEEGVPASLKEDVLTFEEIVTVVGVFSRLGVRTVRFTGGEPLLRKGLPALIGMVRDTGITDLALTTNGTALAHHARGLVAAGLKRINVSVDSIDPTIFRTITRGGDLSRVLEGIDAIIDAGIEEVKINAVVVRGINDHGVDRLVEWAWSKNITPRFIELMPLGEGAKLGRDAVVSSAEVQAMLAGLLRDEPADHRRDRGPAGYLRSIHDPTKTVGFIGAVTDNFCHRCNRVRVTAKGELRACLASTVGASLRDILRADHGEEALVGALEDALYGKRPGHEFYAPGVTRHHAVDMSRIGG